MSDRESVLEALFEKDLLSHLGMMLGGFVHSINGPLHNISLLVDRLGKNQQELNELVNREPFCHSEEARSLSLNQLQRMQQLLQQISILTNVVHDFRTFQQTVRNQAKVDLCLTLTRLVDICRCDRFVKYEVNVELDVARDLPLVPIPGVRLVPALMHLFQNALQAVREVEKKSVAIQCRRDGERVWVVFRDSGCGFEPDIGQEAFFRLFCVNWPDPVAPSEDAPRHAGFGLYATRELLAPYGVKVSLRREGQESLAVLDIPLSG